MSVEIKDELFSPPALDVQVVEHGTSVRSGWLGCGIGDNVAFSTSRLETYCITQWDPMLYDALLLAAAVEFADRTQRRPAMSWGRELQLMIPVHDRARWNDKHVTDSLHEVLNFLTGDRWHLCFCGRRKALSAPAQGRFNLPPLVKAVIPFSDGLDSRCVSGLLGQELGDRLIRVRLGSKTCDGKNLLRQKQPFTSVPYRVQAGKHGFVESTARSRGFKFALISGLAAWLTKADEVVVPESGQGALGPALVVVGQGYEDYRSHPLFTERMERFLEALLNHKVRFSFTQLWQTKAETLRQFVTKCPDGASWAGTWSCWQQTRQVSVEKKKRQCGICAACLLRRLSVHGAGLVERKEAYVWENLSAPTFEAGAAASFPKNKITNALREYAIAGTLHMDHLADLANSTLNAGMLGLTAFQLSKSLGLAEVDVQAKLHRLVVQHKTEWKNFMDSLGRNSFLGNWAAEVKS